MRRSTLIVAGALLFALVVFLIVPRFTGRQAAQQAVLQPQVVRLAADSVLVAAKNLPAGKVVALEDLKWQRWPEEALNPAFFVQEKGADPQKVAVGMIVLHGLEAGEPFTAARLLKPGDASFMSAALTPGLRAETVPIGVASGEAGFILPQDHVDVLLKEQFALQNSPDVVQAQQNLPQVANQRTVVSVVLRDVTVLAINQQVADLNSMPITGPATATLEVDLVQAQKLEVAESLGTLSLVLRSHTLPQHPEAQAATTSVADFQADPYRGAVIEEIDRNLAAGAQPPAGASAAGGGGQIYHGPGASP